MSDVSRGKDAYFGPLKKPSLVLVIDLLRRCFPTQVHFVRHFLVAVAYVSVSLAQNLVKTVPRG